MEARRQVVHEYADGRGGSGGRAPGGEGLEVEEQAGGGGGGGGGGQVEDGGGEGEDEEQEGAADGHRAAARHGHAAGAVDGFGKRGFLR